MEDRTAVEVVVMPVEVAVTANRLNLTRSPDPLRILERVFFVHTQPCAFGDLPSSPATLRPKLC